MIRPAGSFSYIQIKGNRPSHLTVRTDLWHKLSPGQKAELNHLIANTEHDPQLGRTRVMKLEDQTDIDEVPLQSIRLKGICPMVLDDGTIPPHRGQGYVPHPFQVRPDGMITFQQLKDGAPEGSLTGEHTLREFFSASALGPFLTDLALGFGIYSDLSFGTKSLGFVLYGQESEQDSRLFNDLMFPTEQVVKRAPSQIQRLMLTAHQEQVFLRFGTKLGLLHQTHAHRYPHQNNVGIVGYGLGILDVRLRDLDNCLPLSVFTPQQRYAFLFLDLLRVIRDLAHVRIERRDNASVFFDFTHLIAPFLQGYYQEVFSAGADYRPTLPTSEDILTSLMFLAKVTEQLTAWEIVDPLSWMAGQTTGFVPSLHRGLCLNAGLTAR